MSNWEDILLEIKETQETYNSLSLEGQKEYRENFRTQLFSSIENFSTEVEGATSTALYSGVIKDNNSVDSEGNYNLQAQKIADDIARKSNGRVRIIDRTELGQFLSNEDFVQKVRDAFDDDLESANEFLFGKRDGSEKGLWDKASVKFVAETETENVFSITPNASDTGVFARTEIESLLNNSNITTVNGINKASLQRIYSVATDAGEDGYLTVKDVLAVKSRSDLHGALKYYDNADGERVFIYDDFATRIGNNDIPRMGIPEGVEVFSADIFGEEKPSKNDFDTWVRGTNYAFEFLDDLGKAGDILNGIVVVREVFQKFQEGDIQGATNTLNDFITSEIGSLTGSGLGFILAAGLVAAIGPSAGVATAVTFAATTVGGYVGEQYGDEILEAYLSFIRGIDSAIGYVSSKALDILEELEPEYFRSLRESFINSSTLVSPLVLIDPSGERAAANSGALPALEDISLEDSEIEYNLYGDQDDPILVPTGWISSDEAFLALDRNDNGTIDSLFELFGSVAHADGGVSPHGFATLAEYDDNEDYVIDSNDDVFASLQLWKDVNQDGISQSEELATLADFDITSIDTRGSAIYNSSRYNTDAGNIISHYDRYTRADGTEGEIVDIWFQTDTTAARHGGDYELDSDVLDLPLYAGVGLLPSLPRAASENPALKTHLQEFATFVPASGTEASAINGIIDQILFSWVEAEDIEPDFRGEHIDARKISFLEAFFGSFLNDSRGNLDNIGTLRAEAMEEVYSDVSRQLTLRLAAQTDFLGAVLPEDAYNPLADEFYLDTEDYRQVLQGLASRAPEDSNGYWDYWKQLGTLVVDLGLEVTTDNDEPLASEVLNTILVEYTWGLTAHDLVEKSYVGTNEVDTFSDDRQSEGTLFHGLEGDDTLSATFSLDDTDDTFLYAVGDGIDSLNTYHAEESHKRLVLGKSITPETITLISNPSDKRDLIIQIDIGEGGQIILDNQLSGIMDENNNVTYRGGVDDVYFSETKESWDAFELIDAFVQQNITDGDDLIYGTGLADTLRGGIGNDTLLGYGYNDTYLYEAGNDVIEDRPGASILNSYDIVELPEGINREDIIISKSDSFDVVLTFTDFEGSITLTDQLASQQLNWGIDEVRTASGEVFYWEEILSSMTTPL